jgi:hypothetical protein
MNSKVLFTALIVALFLSVSCHKEDANKLSQIDNEALATITDEVIADLNFADLLNDSDDGLFWGDSGFSMFKSAEITDNHCWSKRVKVEEGNKIIVTLEFNGDCEKEGTIIIEYLKPNDRKGVHKKKITYVSFKRKGVTYNGTKIIVRGNGNYNIKGDITIVRQNEDGEEVTITRNYQREVHWICGLDTRKERGDDIYKVSGKTEVTRTVGEETKSYSRKILKPLLFVKACELKIQAGSVKIIRGDNSEILIDYGTAPGKIDCGATFECGTKFTVTKDGETFEMEFVDGKRVKVTEDK